MTFIQKNKLSVLMVTSFVVDISHSDVSDITKPTALTTNDPLCASSRRFWK